MIQFIEQLYGPFFSGANWSQVITSGNDWLVILSLALIECLLSVDNAVVLAAQTQSLDNLQEREKSLFYGLWGAYIFRFLIIGIGTYLISFWEIKVLGAAYLLYLVYRFFTQHQEKTTTKPVKQHRWFGLSHFWSVVLQIEMMDIIFSIDSVLASLAISSNPVIVLIGGMLGIACMRGIAEVIMRLMRKIPELETMAYVLIVVIAIKLFISIPAIDWDIPASIFGMIVLGAFVITLGIHFVRRSRRATKKGD
ncbi:TerC family protein [Lactiplantibacillus daowaiensis]|uniref:TerC family protein n=1 Tax=Lactiplantibacillus daowaiensis TaxID=2559918 RepID=A0ABW1S311_9LACO|nr:TerC family protein [Lactiplantibacillus daowaiensis]